MGQVEVAKSQPVFGYTASGKKVRENLFGRLWVFTGFSGDIV
jgi:hypothetical protein